MKSVLKNGKIVARSFAPKITGCSGTTYSITDDFSSALDSALWVPTSNYETSGGELKRAITGQATLDTQQHTFDSTLHTTASSSIDFDATLDVGQVFDLKYNIGSGGKYVRHFVRKDIVPPNTTSHVFEYADENGTDSVTGPTVAAGVLLANVGWKLTKTGTSGTGLLFKLEFLIDSVVSHTINDIRFKKSNLCSCYASVQIRGVAARADNFSLVSS